MKSTRRHPAQRRNPTDRRVAPLESPVSRDSSLMSPEHALPNAPAAPLPALLPTATVELSFFAPTIESAALIGDFSRWEDLPMTKDKQGNWHIALELPDGDYKYQFRAPSKSWFYAKDQWVTFTDPKATRVDSATGQGILRIRHGKPSIDEYQWQHDDKPLPPNNQLIIYELHVADFSGGEADPFERGKFKHVTEKLDYLVDLGINCIELLPIKEYPGEYAWGYTPQFLFAPESAYGPPEDLKRLIDECHARGIRVIFDGVYNHAHTDNPLAQIDHDYWFHHDPKDKNMSWGPQYNYEHYDAAHDVMPARKFIYENILFWVGQYHIDGIRYDAAKQLENFDAMKMMSDAGRTAAGWTRTNQGAWKAGKPFINFAEYLPETPDLVGPPDSGKPMDGCWHDTFYWTVADRAIAQGELDFERLKHCLQPLLKSFSDCTQLVNYASNHDHLRLMPHMAKSLVFDEHAFRRAKLAATLVLTAVGIPMIWMGEEFADYHGKAMDPQKIDWTLLKNERNQQLRDHYKRIIALRREHPALHGNELEFLFENADDGLLTFLRFPKDSPNRKILIIANLRDRQHDSYTITNLPDGTWKDWISGEEITIENHTLTTPLHPWQARVLVSA